MTTEFVGVIVKEVRRARLDEVPEEAINGFNPIISGRDINIVLPEGGDVKVACELIKSGWNDIFDVLLYAIGKRVDVKIFDTG